MHTIRRVRYKLYGWLIVIHTIFERKKQYKDHKYLGTLYNGQPYVVDLTAAFGAGNEPKRKKALDILHSAIKLK